MRVLLNKRAGGAWGYITDGIMNALIDKGHVVQRYDGNLASWNRFAPDLCILSSGHKQDIPRSRTAKLALHVNPYGPVEVAGINEGEDTIDWVVKQNPDVVFGYGFEQDRILWSYWYNKHNIKWVPFPTAADKVLYRDLHAVKEYDIVYLGGRWSYKGKTIDVYLVPLLRTTNVTYKLYGWGGWQHDISSGVLAEDRVVPFLNSGKVGPCISERHTQQYQIDIPERVWKVALCGCLAVHDPVPSLKDNFSSAIIAQNPQNFIDLCVHYSRSANEAERLEMVANQQYEILAKHTYHHRLADLFDGLGWLAEADNMRN